MSAHRVALVERARAILQLRALERQGAPAADALARVQQVSSVLKELVAAHRFPFDDLCRALELGGIEREALALAAAPHLDDSLRDDLRAYRGDPARGHVDAALVVDLFCTRRDEAIDSGWRLAHDGALARAGLLDVDPMRLRCSPSRLALELIPTARLLGLLWGRVVMDPRVEECAQLVAADATHAVGLVAREELGEMGARFRAAVGRDAEDRRPGRVACCGAAGLGKTRLVSALAAGAGFTFLVEVDALLLPRAPDELAARLRLLDREARIHCGLLVVRCRDLGPERLSLIAGSAERLEGPVVYTTRGDEDPLGRLAAAIDVRRPAAELRAAAWRVELAARGIAVADEQVVELAGDHPGGRGEIAAAVEMACRRADGGAVTPELLAATARERIRSQLQRFAVRSRSRTGLTELVAAPHVLESVREIIHAVRHRARVLSACDAAGLPFARGIVALFNGPPGTGKTLSAGVVANEAGLPLYRVDVPALLDRYVGETEKKLARLFEEAAADRAALVFDEADSLFSKRVEVRDATDRYANGQVNLLLNLIEDYEGLVILTTNLKGSLDPALMRRITFKVEFPLPDGGERLTLWRKHLEGGLPLAGDLDLARLAAEFSISGGVIRNVALRAALMAGGTRPLDGDMLRRAVIAELEASGNVVCARRRLAA